MDLRRESACLWGLLALMGLPGAALAQGTAAPEGKTLAAFCTGLDGIIARENAREASEFAASLAAMPDTVRGERRLPSEAVLTRDEAVAVAERLWAMWMPTMPAARVVVMEDGADAWRLGPAPGPGPSYAGEPIRIDKRTGKVTWMLPHPSERERLHARVCAPAGSPPP